MKFKHYKSDISEIIKGIGLDALKLRNKNILLVGANGFLGKYFVKCFEKILEEKKIKFSLDCFDNHISSKKSEYKDLSKAKEIKFYNADINDTKLKKNITLLFTLRVLLVLLYIKNFHSKHWKYLTPV